jgi:aldose 1-epimerase
MSSGVRRFGEVDGKAVDEILLVNGAGATASILTWGATVRDLRVPVGGGLRRVVLGYRDMDAYAENPSYLGTTAGRYANRTHEGRFVLGGLEYQLPLNEGGRTHLHGGVVGFSRRPWTVVERTDDSVTLRLVSEDGDQGYPGEVVAECRYILAEPAALRIEFSATTDAPTYVSLAHHSYFTLGGDVRDHRLCLNAPFYTPVDEDKIPTGEIRTVAGTTYDFGALRRIGDAGYDHNFVLAGEPGTLRRGARLEAPDGSLAMELFTTEPAVQFYDGHMLSELAQPIDDQVHAPYAGLCLEPQRFPDAPNHPHFPSALLMPGDTYTQVTEYRFVS